MKKLIAIVFYVGIILLILITIFKNLILSSNPGFLQGIPNQLEIALWSIKNGRYAQILLIFIIAYPFFYLLLKGKAMQKMMVMLLSIVAICSFLLISKLFNNGGQAAELTDLKFTNIASTKVDLNDYVLGVSYGNRQKAYPLDVMSHHKQIHDKIGVNPLLITYDNAKHAARVYLEKHKLDELNLKPFGFINNSPMIFR